MPGIEEVEKLPTTQKPLNRPSSGTYGEKVALENLRGALPSGGSPAGPAAGGPAGPVGGGVSDQPVTRPPATAGGGGIAGVPAPILKPTSQPSVDVGAPPQGPSASPVQSGAQRRLHILDQLANNPHVSSVTREWAERVMKVLVG